MQISFDKVADALYIRFSWEDVKETEEVDTGIIIDYGNNDDIIGIEILNYSKRGINLNELIQLNAEEIVPEIIRWQ